MTFLVTFPSEVLTRLGHTRTARHRQASPRGVDYRRFYTPATSRAVATRYAEDIEPFGDYP